MRKKQAPFSDVWRESERIEKLNSRSIQLGFVPQFTYEKPFGNCYTADTSIGCIVSVGKVAVRKILHMAMQGTPQDEHTHTETRLEARDEHGQTEACMWKTNTNTHASGQTNLQVCECWRWCWSIAVLYNALSSHQGTQKCKLRTVQRDKRQSQAASDFRIALAFAIPNLRFDIHIKWKHICLIVNEIFTANVKIAAKNRAIKAQKLHANKRVRKRPRNETHRFGNVEPWMKIGMLRTVPGQRMGNCVLKTASMWACVDKVQVLGIFISLD